MVNLLRRLFIKDYENVKNQSVRQSHAKLASFVGIISNFILFIIKLLAGFFSKSVSIIADSVNNLSDMGSSVVTLIGFKMANKPADEEHPFGHQRMEYIAGFIVAILIVFVGASLAYTSVGKIIHYEYKAIPRYISYISIGILGLSIFIKLWQSLFNRRIGILIDSVALKATACDSRNDVISTLVILIGTVVMLFVGDVGFSIDGILGVFVSLFILYSGVKLLKDTVNPLLGNSISKEYVEEILTFIKKNSAVLGIHDVVCHLYGPTKCFMTLHAEVDAKKSIIESHDAIDEIESEVKRRYDVELTIHMDPIELDNEEVNRLRNIVGLTLKRLDKELNFHDLRIVRKNSIPTVIFDVVVPYKYSISTQEIKDYVYNELNRTKKEYNIIIHFDHQFIKKEE